MYFCSEMFTNIRFDVDLICSCCTNCRGVTVPVNNNSDIEQVMNNYFKKADDIFLNILNNNEENIVNNCYGCYKLKETINYNKNTDDLKINFINIANWRTCNLNCIYCCFKKEKKQNTLYNVYPYIKYLKEHNKLSDSLQIVIGGGTRSIGKY